MANEENVIVGGPGEPSTPAPKEEAPPPAGPKMVEAMVDGVKVLVPEVFANQYAAMQAEITSLASKINAMSRPEKKEESEKEDPFADIDTLMFSDPKAAAKRIVEHSVRQAAAVVGAQQSAMRDREAFWREFYASHKELDADVDGPVVEAVMAREYSKMADMTVGDAIKYLGEKSKAQLLKIAQRRGAGGGDARPSSEPANTPASGESKHMNANVGAHKQHSLVDILKERRAARMKAARG